MFYEHKEFFWVRIFNVVFWIIFVPVFILMLPQFGFEAHSQIMFFTESLDLFQAFLGIAIGIITSFVIAAILLHFEIARGITFWVVFISGNVILFYSLYSIGFFIL